ncbi:MAG: UDP-GlcNAc:undecaprenyl-phosphate GlcNAc-1-phosphate transferase [Desulforhopalus sp.]|jgi:UDP-GlcNAc:undecaprenyl-phosphate GlcNAc-1-phosphate transferase
MLTFEMRIILVFLVSFFSVIIVLPKIANIAQRIGLLDQPNARKVHTRPRPLVGGIGMVIAVTFASLAFIPIVGLRGYFLGLAILLLVGFFDDFREMGHQQKFLAQIIATGAMIYFSKVALVTFGDLLGMGEINIPGGYVAIWIVTIFCVVGVTNAMNLIDGLDGLAGGLAFIAFLFFAAHASFADNHTLMLLSLALAGAILGFLKFNWHPSVLFMGDAGSLCLGFSLAFMALALTQGPGSTISPVVPLLILAVPITDTLIVMTKRIAQGKSPFKPDKYHVHHIFLRYGMGRTQAVQVILAISVLLGSLSLLGPIYGLNDMWLFLLFGIYFSVYLTLSFFILGFFRYSLKIRKKREHLAGTDLILRFIFGGCDFFRIFRKTKRYNVRLAMNCCIGGEEPVIRGQLLNISTTGCMVKMKHLETEEKMMTLSLHLPDEVGFGHFELKAEHLWSSNHEGDCFHGFRFAQLPPEKTEQFSGYMTRLATQQQQLTGKQVTV